MREDLKEKSNMFSSEHIENKVLTTICEHPSSEYHFESKVLANISLSDQKNEKLIIIDRVQVKTP